MKFWKCFVIIDAGNFTCRFNACHQSQETWCVNLTLLQICDCDILFEPGTIEPTCPYDLIQKKNACAKKSYNSKKYTEKPLNLPTQKAL